jgi:DNA-binding NarL/FixJ family response regulator
VITIFIVDDHVMFSDGLASVLAQIPDFKLIGRAVTGADALRQIALHPPDVLLLDINLPDISGLEVCRQIQTAWPEVRIIALSTHNEETYISEMMRFGAQGYLLKNTDVAELQSAIRALADGKTYFCKEVTDTIMRGLVQGSGPNARPVAPKISRRERDVLRLIVDERTTQEIASELFVSEKTVESHRAALLTKLGARNAAGLVKVALKWELLKEDAD